VPIPAGGGSAPDPTTDVGMVRILATDINLDSPLFTDEQIEAFLALEGGVVKRAAALALESIAVSETLISKKITTSDGLSTDGPAVAKALLDRAKMLREQAQSELDIDNSFGLEIVDYDPLAAYRTW
jgi:hypothetical protein